ncbi:chorismate mutase [Pseudomonas sp. BT-42-2]|jgi:chorismate mutase|uniref:chorismate mutase n=1 Tax=unclassified Pseudomonas TaxID=196821 RepID=UPI0021F74E5C|nr:chorismate mutase [Pseudomonas sp. BT-42-2]MCV9920053.1 chorismate mutase [Pseudomonas sp. BT-42-2]
MRLASLALCCALGLTGCSAEPVDPALSRLLDSIERRLALAEAVALHKWDRQQPVQATAREQSVLDAVRRSAPAHQLSTEHAEAFFADQMEANKLLQYALLSQWRLDGEAPDLPRQDLQSKIRPRLDVLQDDLLRNLAQFRHNRSAQCPEQVASALRQREGDFLHYLAMIRASGQLCE